MIDQAFNQECLVAHNNLRALHGNPPLAYDEELAEAAQKWADHLAEQGIMEHSPESEESIGENVAMKYDSTGAVFTGKEASDDWYSEIEMYNFDEENQLECGHFSQLVWKSTQRAGFGRATSASGYVFAVGQYLPPGNFNNKWRENVPPPIPGMELPEDPTPADSTPVSSHQGSVNKPLSHPGLNAGGDHPYPGDDYYGSQVNELPDLGAENNVNNVDYYEDASSKQEMNEEDVDIVVEIVNEAEQLQDSEESGEEPPVDLEEFRLQILESHNGFREKHHSPALNLNPELSNMAQSWAEYLRDSGLFVKTDWTYLDEPIGESTQVQLYDGDKLTGYDLSTTWYAEGQRDFPYGEDPRRMKRKCSRFSQMLWSESRELGVGRAQDKEGHTWFVCFYYPEGNVRNQYAENVQPEE